MISCEKCGKPKKARVFCRWCGDEIGFWCDTNCYNLEAGRRECIKCAGSGAPAVKHIVKQWIPSPIIKPIQKVKKVVKKAIKPVCKSKNGLRFKVNPDSIPGDIMFDLNTLSGYEVPDVFSKVELHQKEWDRLERDKVIEGRCFICDHYMTKDKGKYQKTYSKFINQPMCRQCSSEMKSKRDAWEMLK